MGNSSVASPGPVEGAADSLEPTIGHPADMVVSIRPRRQDRRQPIGYAVDPHEARVAQPAVVIGPSPCGTGSAGRR